MMLNKAKHIFVVLGMARSGTSAIAHGLQTLGVDLGQHLKAPNQKWNAKGFFEDNDIVYKINRGVLRAMNHTYSSLHLKEEDYFANPEVKLLKQAACKLLHLRLQDTVHYGFKDPRTANILPFWQAVFSEVAARESYVIALRNPLSSAHSYHHVTGTDVEYSLLLWMMHLIAAIDDTHDRERIIVSYENVLQNPKQELLRVQEKFQLASDAKAIENYANTFLDKQLQRFVYSKENLATNTFIKCLPLCAHIYDLLFQVSNDQLQFQDAYFVKTWSDIKKELAYQMPVYDYLDQLYQRKKTLQKQLKTIQKSLPWKSIFLLRFLDDRLRSFRNKFRQRKRTMHVVSKR